MTTKRKSYSKQFKIDAVRLVNEKGYKISEAARNLEINPNVLRKWKDQLKYGSDQAFPGKGHKTAENKEIKGHHTSSFCTGTKTGKMSLLCSPLYSAEIYVPLIPAEFFK